MSMNIDRQAKRAARREAFVAAYERGRHEVILKALRKQLMRTSPNSPEVIMKATGDLERDRLMSLGFTVKSTPDQHSYGGQWVKIYWLTIPREKVLELLAQ